MASGLRAGPRVLAVAAVTALALGFAPSYSEPAQAARVSAGCTGLSCDSRSVSIVDERKETNDITVSRPSETEVRVVDRASSLDAGASCARVTEFEVVCDLIKLVPASTDRLVFARLAEGDDRLEVGGFPKRHLLEGGPGNDRVEVESGSAEVQGGDGDDVLVGGPGTDLLEGGTGDDGLSGGAGNDLLWGEKERSRRSTESVSEPSDDTVDGGPGIDQMSYEYRGQPVRADLEAMSAGQEGENDRLMGIEALIGGSRDDELRGTNEADRLDGGGGKDLLDGRSGDDTLIEGERVLGGEGADSVSSFGFAGLVSVACGGGLDHVKLVFVSRATSVDPDCEQLDLALATHQAKGVPDPYTNLGVRMSSIQGSGPAIGRPFASTRLRCNGAELGYGRGPCRLGVSVQRVGGAPRRVAQASTAIPHGRTRSLPLRLSKAARRRLVLDGVMRVRVDVSVAKRNRRGASGRRTASYFTEIRAPGSPTPGVATRDASR